MSNNDLSELIKKYLDNYKDELTGHGFLLFNIIYNYYQNYKIISKGYRATREHEIKFTYMLFSIYIYFMNKQGILLSFDDVFKYSIIRLNPLSIRTIGCGSFDLIDKKIMILYNKDGDAEYIEYSDNDPITNKSGNNYRENLGITVVTPYKKSKFNNAQHQTILFDKFNLFGSSIHRGYYDFHKFMYNLDNYNNCKKSKSNKLNLLNDIDNKVYSIFSILPYESLLILKNYYLYNKLISNTYKTYKNNFIIIDGMQ